MSGIKGQKWKKEKKPSKIHVTSRVSMEIKERITEISKKHRRTESQIIEFLLEAGIYAYDKGRIKDLLN